MNKHTEGQMIGIRNRTRQPRPALSMIVGGTKVTNRDNFPWFAWIRTSFPHFKWRYWDPAEKVIKTKDYIKSTPVAYCSGVWVTIKHVLTADHCMWLSREKEHAFGKNDDPRGLDQIPFFKNKVRDRSTYIDPKTKEKTYRGSLDNISVKLYGTTFGNGHPQSSTKINAGIFEPWFGKGQRAFRVTQYAVISGGVNAGGQGFTDTNSIDVAILTLKKHTVSNYFNGWMDTNINVFSRLKWDDNGDLGVKDKAIILGAGIRGGNNYNLDQQVYYTTAYKKNYTSQCSTTFPTTFNPSWNICLTKTGGNDKLIFGDSGGPLFTEIEPKLHMYANEKRYRLHSLQSISIGEDFKEVFHVYVGDKKSRILPNMLVPGYVL